MTAGRPERRKFATASGLVYGLLPPLPVSATNRPSVVGAYSVSLDTAGRRRQPVVS